MTGPARRSLLAPVLVGALGLTGIVALHDIPVRHRIEDNLLGRSTLALNAAELPQARVDVTGRDVVITGVAAADATRARDVVLGVRGVRVARVVAVAGVERATAAPTPRDQLPVSLTFDDDTVTLTGSVGSQQQRDELVTSLEAAGLWSVADELVVDPALAAATTPAPAAVAEVVKAVPQPGDGLIVRYADGDGIVRGTVGSAEVETAVLDAVRAGVAKGGRTEDHVDVRPDRAAVKKELAALPRITFRTGSTRLTPEGGRAVGKAAAILKAAGKVAVRVDGHTDSSGSAALNLQISRQRAKVVRDRLVELGVSGDLTSKGFGETKPLVEPRSAAAAARNRRVEFTLR